MNGYNRMMTRAMVLYNQTELEIGPQDLSRNRVELAEAMVGEAIELEEEGAHDEDL